MVAKAFNLLLLSIFVLFSLVEVTSSSKPQIPDEPDEQQWRDCQIFLAPSRDNMGWGVFAARDFAKGELVELSPLDISIEHTHPVIKNTIIGDYVYGWERRMINTTTNEEVVKLMSVLSWGMVKYYNHRKVPNVEWTLIGSEPDNNSPESMLVVGVIALQDISAGSEMFYDYGGERWFSERRIEIIDIPDGSNRVLPDELENLKSQYCSKVYSGLDYFTFYHRIKSSKSKLIDARKLLPSFISEGGPLLDFSTIAKVSIAAGERLLAAPGLVVDNRAVHGSLLAPLVFAWDDLDEPNQQNIRRLKDEGHITVQYQGLDTDWHPVDRFEQFDYLAIVSEATLVARVGPEKAAEANCRLEITASESRDDSAGILVELIATKNIEAGQAIKLNLYPAGHGLLYKERRKMGAVRLHPKGHALRDEICLMDHGC